MNHNKQPSFFPSPKNKLTSSSQLSRSPFFIILILFTLLVLFIIMGRFAFNRWQTHNHSKHIQNCHHWIAFNGAFKLPSLICLMRNRKKQNNSSSLIKTRFYEAFNRAKPQCLLSQAIPLPKHGESFWLFCGANQKMGSFRIIPISSRKRVLLGIPISLNRSSAKELSNIPRLSLSLAHRIVKLRYQKKKFSYFDELLEVKGIGKTTLKRIKPYLYLK